MHHLGTHLLIELYECSASTLNNASRIEQILVCAAKKAGATIVSSHSNLFNPHGVSAVVIIAESHLTIHTWPEHRYAAVDVFTCGDKVKPWQVQAYLVQGLGAQRCSAMEIRRGLFEHAVDYKAHRGEDLNATSSST